MAHLACDPQNLIWVDCEMTGLEPSDRILEISIVVTNTDLTARVQGPTIAIHQSDGVLDSMDHWNRDTHGRNGLTKRSRLSHVDERKAEEKILAFLKSYVPVGRSPLCGNNVGQDRMMLKRYMPHLHGYFTYSDMDVHTLIEAAKRWNPRLAQGFVRKNAHRADVDVNEAVDMARYYQRMFRKS